MLRHIDDGVIFENFDEERRRLDRRGDRIAIVVVERAPNRRRKRLVYEIFSSAGLSVTAAMAVCASAKCACTRTISCM